MKIVVVVFVFWFLLVDLDFVDIVLSGTQRRTPTVIHTGYAIARIRRFYMRKVRFTAENGGTRVELVHRGLRSYGEKAEHMRVVFDSKEGWAGMLESFAARASAA